MPTPNHVKEQINEHVRHLMQNGLIDGDPNFAFQRPVRNGHKEITFKGAEHIQVALRDRSYKEIYQELAQERAYNAKMLDGALLQMMYTFAGDTIQRHRLAFFSAPHLEEFRNNPDIYLDEIYADVVAKNIVPFPLRFDYDIRNQGPTHPKSHLSLGQYKDCRIPVSAPLTPFWFVDFILRNFYPTASSQCIASLPARGRGFPESINSNEQDMIHVIVPS